MHPGHHQTTAIDPSFIVLRDGSVANVRPCGAGDLDALDRFFRDLSPDSRLARFHADGETVESVVQRLCHASDPSTSIGLVALRSIGGDLRIIAVGTYVRVDDDSADIAFAVADRFHGKGLGTALLERLAASAIQYGLRTFRASTTPDNERMLGVFRDSGFDIRSKSEGGVIDVRMTLAPDAGSVAAEEQRHRVATIASLRPLLEPQAVAVIGVSRDRGSVGRRVLEAILAAGFKGPIYPVNPKANELAGLKVCASAKDLPPGVDLAVVTVPCPAVLNVVDDCALAGVKALVVITAGFAEAGAEGRALQRQLTDKVRNYGMRMVGPNCMGLLNASPGVSLNASFSPIAPPAGRIGLMSQSGALGLAILALATERGIGLSTFVSAGNKADVSGNDLLEYWESDPSTAVILLYLESFGNPRRFARLARRISRQKPIVAIKSGRTRAGTRAASSHTAALAASDVAVDALFHQAGVIRVDTIDEMFDVAALLERQALPEGRGTAIVTNGGGPGILAADACEAAGLTIVEFSDETRARVAAALPSMASSTNPVDVVASAGADAYRRTIEAVLAARETDALIIIFTSVDANTTEEILQAIRDGVAKGRAHAPGKPVLACVMAQSGPPVPLEVAGEQLPTYAFPEHAVRALGKVAAYAAWRRQPPALSWRFDDLDVERARAICRGAREARGETWLNAEEVRRVLQAFRLPVAAGSLARTADEATVIAATIGYPIAAKLSSTSIQHKTDIGAIRLNLPDATSVQQAFQDILDAARRVEPSGTHEGVLIQPMLTGGVETMMGIALDPSFGPLIAFGLGGIHVEILRDVLFRIAPLTDRDADEMLHGIKGFRLLEGYRGHAAADLGALRELLLRLSSLAVELPEAVEVDLNPVIALPPGRGCAILDARIKVA